MQHLNFDEPMPMYKGGTVEYAHSKRQYDDMITAGRSRHYQHQEFPRIVYLADGTTKQVETEGELELAQAEGYGLAATAAKAHVEELIETDQAREIANLKAQLASLTKDKKARTA